MSNSEVSEDFRYITTYDDLSDVEFSNIDTDILMSFLEESQIEESDEEKIRQVIQSLEAEISPVLINDSNSLTESRSTSSDLEFEWIDPEIECSTPSDDKSIWFMDYSRDEIDDEFKFIDTTEFSQIYDGVMWEETCESILL
ncbi:hypothetical protein RND71_015359 [Anisodus tanguticus]|uniref:Uncharacterized protein n=1 Tax=Anisodus tanguticus TaxID=243964 RepID=A0AAE1VHL7_9SOLA|nr:hypothetical protein RND71_015359 [Anisodus tanguticus]